MSVGKTSFLKLDDINETDSSTEESPFGQVVQEFIEFEFEDSENQLRTILCYLTQQQFESDIRSI